MANAMATGRGGMGRRREYKSGSVYQRASDERWIGSIEAGWTAEGKRRRVVVTAKTERLCKAKLHEKKRQIAQQGVPQAPERETVKHWAETWLAMKRETLRPKAYNAAASAVTKWIIPTVGHVRLEALRPSHLRQVQDAQIADGLKTATAAATHRTFLNLLREAQREGFRISAGALTTKAPTVPKSDRTAISGMEALALLSVASTLPHGSRWLFTVLHGVRQGEALGLTWDSIDFDAGEIRLNWQLQALPYIDRKNKALGFRVPRDFQGRHLVDAFHLTPPKSKAGVRVLPLVEVEREALLRWREEAPVNPWGLVWPTAAGRPANNKHDLLEWHALQGAACVGHPAGRYYHVHETRNLASTNLDEVNATENVVTSMLGHSSYATSLGYMSANMDRKRAVMEEIAAKLSVPGFTAPLSLT